GWLQRVVPGQHRQCRDCDGPPVGLPDSQGPSESVLPPGLVLLCSDRQSLCWYISALVDYTQTPARPAAPPRSPRLRAHATGAPYCSSRRQMAGHPPAAAPDDTPPQQAGGGYDSMSSVADRPVLGGPRLNTQDTALRLAVRSELCEFPVLLEYKIHCLDT